MHVSPVSEWVEGHFCQHAGAIKVYPEEQGSSAASESWECYVEAQSKTAAESEPGPGTHSRPGPRASSSRCSRS